MSEILAYSPDNEKLDVLEIEKEQKTLYHVSAFEDLRAVDVGDSFVLVPGQQNAEGPGVYFSENKPRFTAAEGVNKAGGESAVVVIRVSDYNGWWRTKGSKYKRFNRPRTWHSDGKSMKCIVKKILGGEKC